MVCVSDVNGALPVDGNRRIMPRIRSGIENRFGPCSVPTVHHAQAVRTARRTRIVVWIDNNHLALFA